MHSLTSDEQRRAFRGECNALQRQRHIGLSSICRTKSRPWNGRARCCDRCRLLVAYLDARLLRLFIDPVGTSRGPLLPLDEHLSQLQSGSNPSPPSVHIALHGAAINPLLMADPPLVKQVIAGTAAGAVLRVGGQAAARSSESSSALRSLGARTCGLL